MKGDFMNKFFWGDPDDSNIKTDVKAEVENITVNTNNWFATIIVKTKKFKTKYYISYSETSEEKEFKTGALANDLLCLCKWDHTKEPYGIILNEQYFNKWLNKYFMPPLSIDVLKDVEQENDIIYCQNNQWFQPELSNIKRYVPKSIFPFPTNIDDYHIALKHRWQSAILSATKTNEARFNLNVLGTWYKGVHTTSYFFQNDIYPLILFDINNATDKYKLKECPICKSYYFPIEGRTHCAGCEKPISRLSKQELLSAEIKSTSISNNYLRSARIKQLRREGKSHDDMNCILDKEGFPPIRSKNAQNKLI